MEAARSVRLGLSKEVKTTWSQFSLSRLKPTQTDLNQLETTQAD